MEGRKLISVMTPCYNEEGNVEVLYEAVKAIFEALPQYDFEHIFIDNASVDGTRAKLRALAARDPRVKVIFNTRNFGQVRSPYHGVLQAFGDAVIPMAADMQDPPTLIPKLIEQWEGGYKVVQAVKMTAKESPLMFAVRKVYYRLVTDLSEVRLVKNATGFGLYDKQVIDILRTMDESYPYFRGLTAELGFQPALVEYEQPLRASGKSTNNFFTLFDVAMAGITSHSRVPLRVATMIGFGGSVVSLLVALAYLIYKLANWQTFSAGTAPLVIGLFFLGSVQLFFLGVVGEYVGAIYTQVLHRPLVVEQERINF
jgi:glycosyltransferase involved in cell wall biosynthesis